MVDRKRWLIVLAGPAILAAACSGASKPKISPDDAAAAVATTFSLPSAEQDCLATGFSDHPHAAEALEPSTSPTEHQLDEFSKVLAPCVTPESLAASVAASVTKGIGTVTATQENCVSTAVVGLSDDDRTVLMTGLAATNAQGTTTIGVALGRVTSGLLDGCGISVAAPPGTSPGTDSGAATVTR